jgi:polar amino acid transport system substrate-binding protein
MKIRGLPLALMALAFSASVFAAEPLRVCADPDNLPFSKSEGPERGLYVDLAELVAQRLEATPVHYTWWLTFYQRRALRNTAGDCDAVFALPTNADYRARGLQKTAAFLDVGYALVAAPGFQFNSLNDLKGKRLAVQFQTNPHIVLSQMEGFTFSTFRTSDEVFEALAKGEAEAGFLWGPVAGYDNQRRFGSRWRVTPLTGNDMNGQVSVAVSRDKPELIKSIDAALLALKPEIAALAQKYGFPQGKPVNIAQTSPTLHAPVGLASRALQVPSKMLSLTQAKSGEAAASTDSSTKPKSQPATKAATAGVNAQKTKQAAGQAEKAGVAVQAAKEQTPALSQEALLGRVRFNDQCSHCHGSDGASPIRERDVRRLKMRYDAKWVETATTTIKNGRADLGMPPWKDMLKEPEIQQLLSFLETVQK